MEKGGSTSLAKSFAKILALVCADTHIMSPRFSISCTAGCMSMGSCTIPKTPYLLRSTRKANLRKSGGFISMAVRTSSEGNLRLRAAPF